jgi:hypothetical protein
MTKVRAIILENKDLLDYGFYLTFDDTVIGVV